MARKQKAFVLDSWAVIAYLEDEQAAEKVADLMSDAHEQGIPLLISVVNAGEVWYIIARQTSSADADRSIKQLLGLGIELVDANWALAHNAAYFKSKCKMSFADAFAAALTKERKATLITGHPEFRQVDQEISIYWLSRN